jgi:glycosyltransferase involved in cell wall biosynthesis
MRVGIDATFLSADGLHTGMGEYVRGLSHGLAAIGGAEVMLLGYGKRPNAAPDGLVWCELPRLPLGKLSPWMSHQVVLPLAARRWRLDVLHVPGVNVRPSRPGIPAFTPCPLVVTMHDAIPLLFYGSSGPALPPRLRLTYQFALACVRRAAAVITVSETSRRDILSCVSLQADRVRAIPNGVDFAPPANQSELLSALGLQRPYLLYAGSYEPRKNLLGAVSAYAAAARQTPLPPLVLVVERESGFKTAVLREVARAYVHERLIFLHSLEDEQLRAVYAGAELLIYPSLYEGFGFVPLQAMACGVPVISSACGALAEILGDAAAYADPSQSEQVGCRIAELWQAPGQRAELGSRGRKQAARYRWTTTAARTLETYRAVARSRGTDTCAASRSR